MTSISDNINYPNFCEQASTVPSIFKVFKQHLIYQHILEHVTYSQGLQYIENFKTSSNIIDKIELFRINDKLGSPITYNYNDFGWFSPTTLRYIQILKDLSQHNLDNKHILEIGAGYGGQYVVLRQLYKPKKYTFVDLPAVLKLIKKYINELGLNDIELEFIDGTQSIAEQQPFLTISNYAFSECVIAEQNKYIASILSNSKHCYMLYNNMNGYTHTEFTNIMIQLNKKVKILDEILKKYIHNVLITW